MVKSEWDRNPGEGARLESTKAPGTDNGKNQTFHAKMTETPSSRHIILLRYALVRWPIIYFRSLPNCVYASLVASMIICLVHLGHSIRICGSV